MDGLCKVLSGVHGTHLAEPGSARGTLLCSWWKQGQYCLAGCSLECQDDGCVKGPPSPAQPLPMPAHTSLKDAAACLAPDIGAYTG